MRPIALSSTASKEPKPQPNIFSATGKFVQAYLKGWQVLSKMDIGAGGKKHHQIGVLEYDEIGSVKVFAGTAAVSAPSSSKPSRHRVSTSHISIR
jgi:hypothetical protein